MSELKMEWWVDRSPHQVYEAFADPFQMRRWYGAPPGGMRLGEEGDEADEAVFRVNVLDAKGARRVQTGRVLQVRTDESFLVQLTWDGGDYGHETTALSFSLHGDKGGTRIELTQGPFSSPEFQEAHRTYWEANLERLLRVVSGEAVPCFEEFWEESSGYGEPLGVAVHAVLAGMREAGAAPELLTQLEDTLYTHLTRLPEETARVLGAVLRERLKARG
jgi:uncharacterized protein YndB with AHSA1/START domain